jgi:probable rRNA maturation factor
MAEKKSQIKKLMTLQIEIQNDHEFDIDEARLQLAAQTVLNAHELSNGGSMSIVVTTNEEVAALNNAYRGIDAPTDVLSFPADDLPTELAQVVIESPYLGDVIIAYPYAAAQAQREGHALQDSLALLVVHGTLHLLGYDHDTSENRAKMWAAQAEALMALHIPTHLVPALEEGRADAKIGHQGHDQ